MNKQEKKIQKTNQTNKQNKGKISYMLHYVIINIYNFEIK